MVAKTFSGPDPTWITPENWTPTGVPGPADTVTISGPVIIPPSASTVTDIHGLTIGPKGVLEGPGYLAVTTDNIANPAGPFSNDGTIEANGNTYISGGPIVGSGSFEIGANATLELDSQTSETIRVNSTPIDTATLDLDVPTFGGILDIAPSTALHLGLVFGQGVTGASITGSTMHLDTSLGSEDIALGGPGYTETLTAEGGANRYRPELLIRAPAAGSTTTPPPTTPPDTSGTGTTGTATPPLDTSGTTAGTGTTGTSTGATTPPVTTPPATTGTTPPTPPVAPPSDTIAPPATGGTVTPPPGVGPATVIAPPGTGTTASAATSPDAGTPAPASPASPPDQSMPVVPIADGGNSPTPLSPAEVSSVNIAAALNPSEGGSETFFITGSHLGADFDALGTNLAAGQGGPATNQVISDMKGLLSAWVASPMELAGRGVPGQFVVDVVNTGLKALTIGSAPLDHAYAGALTQFFGAEQSILMGGAH